MVLLLTVRGKGRFGEGGGGDLVDTEASLIPSGARGWERRAPMMVVFTLLGDGVDGEDVRSKLEESLSLECGFGSAWDSTATRIVSPLTI
jgi:hypothetical protein